MAVSVKPAPITLIDPVVEGSNRWRLIGFSVFIGIFIAYIWSFTLVDSVIGDSVANSLLGFDAKETAITSRAMGAIIAIVSGLAGTFTACNIAAFGCIAPLADHNRPLGKRMGTALRPIGWLALGMVGVAGVYGAIGASIGTRIPQLSEEVIGNGFPVRLLQSSVVFGVIGLIFVYMGLATIRAVPNPLAGLYARHSRAQLVVIGGLIGGFLIGRPFPLFFKMFQYAASTHNALYGGLVFVLQAVGNIIVMSLLFLFLVYGTRGGFQRWLEGKPGRVARFSAGALIVAGSFTFFYWAVKLPALFGYGWWPRVPWN